MYRATTPTHTFEFPFDPADCSVIKITYEQEGKIIMEKEIPDMHFDSEHNKVYYTLTQKETKLFRGGVPFYVQVRVKKGTLVMASQKMKRIENPVINDEVI